MTSTDFFFGVKRIDESCFSIFKAYYEEREKHYLYPVFYQSIIQMIAAGGFFYKIHRYEEDKVLAIYKRSSIMGNWSIMLNIAPISLSGKKINEIKLIQSCRRFGVSSKLSDEDIKRYGIPLKICTPISGNCESLYDAKAGYEMKGSAFRKLRNRVKQVTKREDFQIQTGVSEDIDKLVAKWDAHNHSTKDKKEQTTQSIDFKRIRGLKTDRMYVQRIYTGNSLEIFSVLEKLTERSWCIVFEMRNYDSVLNEANPCMHFYNCKCAFLGNSKGGRTLANKGASLNIEGMHAAKEKLRPCHNQQIYKLLPINKIDSIKLKTVFV